MKKAIIIIIAVALILFGYLYYMNYSNESVEALSKYGSSGEEVKKIQQKLKNWGYYKGNVDGIYGSKTQAAVKSFQKKNGLKQDGIAGEKTLAAMGITSSGNTGGSSNSGGGSASSSDLNLLSRLVYGEARGEQYKGQVAVAAVVLNRVKSSKFPNTVAGVIYQKGAFDVVSDGQINLAPNQTAKNAAQDALNGWDPSNRSIILF
jgi:N-acetylmuramoyl-L-alanine amidase